MKKESLIGSQYVPQDNSYEFNLSCPETQKIRLAGMLYPYKQPTVTIITSEPFDMKIFSAILRERVTLKMVTVDVNKCSYLTMFIESGVITQSNTVEHLFEKHLKHSHLARL